MSKPVETLADIAVLAGVTPATVSRALAEIAPAQTIAGEMTRFTYAILPQLAEEDLGFDIIEIETPVEVASIDEVRIDGDGLHIRTEDGEVIDLTDGNIHF